MQNLSFVIAPFESSYRQMNRVRARTSSTDPALRPLYVGIAFLLINLWVRLKQQYACDLHREPTPLCYG